MAPAPIVIGYDGSPASERAVREAGALLAPRPALVVVVWEAGMGFLVSSLPAGTLDIPPAPIDVRAALEVEDAMYERAQRLAEQGARQAREAGLDAEGLTVADEASVADTLLRLVREREAQAVVVGAHGHRTFGEVLLGSTSQSVVHRAQCPVVVVRQAT
jgi:nucleotide-binding universal stress UspA family protein